jgi:hypothetical protein
MQRKIKETRQRLKGKGQKYKSKGKNGVVGDRDEMRFAADEIWLVGRQK